MIRAGRAHLVVTLADLAAAAGKSLKTFGNQKLHKVPGHPEPINSPKARVLLWDREQIDAFRSGAPVPELPAEDSDDDLLDRNEAADLAGVEPRTWDRYANLPGMRPRPEAVEVAGVEHWRRGDILEWLATRPGPGSSPGRPVGRRDTFPQADLLPQTMQLLEQEPAITAAAIAGQLGINANTAQRALNRARTTAVRRLLEEQPGLTAEDVHDQLGYPLWAAQRALKAATDTDDGD
ncbi:hypothetical protein ABZZ79_29290 [Streptomyces sp. NPDC006458]|uniref:hypothetical protein n=1 Tax=Streptomyces sp. NPDC006458 TaxID=3154302 RepID=UPI0033A3BF9F